LRAEKLKIIFVIFFSNCDYVIPIGFKFPKPKRIGKSQGVVVDVTIEIQPASEANPVFCDKPPVARVILPISVIV